MATISREQLRSVWSSWSQAKIAYDELYLQILDAWDQLSPGEQLLCKQALFESYERLNSAKEEYKKKAQEFFGY